jgi:micrococcal nuclease
MWLICKQLKVAFGWGRLYNEVKMRKGKYILLILAVVVLTGCTENGTYQDKPGLASETDDRPHEKVTTVMPGSEMKKKLDVLFNRKWYVVSNVINGNTMIVTETDPQISPPSAISTFTVRLIGVEVSDTTERSGKKAAEFAREFVEEKQVWLEYDQTRSDEEGVMLAYMHLKTTLAHTPDGEEACPKVLNEKIIRRGYGKVSTKYHFKYMEKYRALEKEAWEAGKGMWASEPEGKTSKELHEEDK